MTKAEKRVLDAAMRYYFIGIEIESRMNSKPFNAALQLMNACAALSKRRRK